MTANRVAERLVEFVEGASALDPVADRAVAVLRRLIPSGRVEDALSGTPAGHPIHPALVSLPIGAWCAATALDASGVQPRATRAVVGFGVLAALPAVTTGANDWATTDGAERRVGLVHAAANWTGIALQIASWRARSDGRRAAGAALSATALAAVALAGWLGGHLSYAEGVGVDTTAFLQLPTEWVDVGPVDAVQSGALLPVEANGVPVVLTRVDDTYVALADRCTHRGGPLHEGTIRAGCVTCPWHGSRFSMTDGSVVSGPASRPQPAFEVRVVGARIQVRRREPRALRRNPVGP